MQNAKQIILGAGGFLGSNLLLSLGGEALGCGRSKAPLHLKGLYWREVDFLSCDDLREALSGMDTVYHLASATNPATAENNKELDIQNNVIGTQRFLDICIECNVKRVVFISSGGTIYGPDVEVPIKETTLTNPISAYGIGKLAIEKQLLRYQRQFGLKAMILRVSNPFGPYQAVHKGQGAVSVFMDKVKRGEHITIYGDGSVVRDYLYVDDVVRAMQLAGSYEGERSVFNIGSGIGRSLLDVIDGISEVTGFKPQIDYQLARAIDVPTNILDISKAKTILGWVPQTDWLEGLAKTWEWIKEQD